MGKYRKEITENESFVAERGKIYQEQPEKYICRWTLKSVINFMCT